MYCDKPRGRPRRYRGHVVSLDDVARMTVYIKDDAYRDDLNREWLKAFPDESDRPARHTLVWDLRGGMLLSYGLHREAGEIFAQLIERGASPAVRDRAWFYLAKIRYQRGFLAEAEEAIARIENHLPADLDEERGLSRHREKALRHRAEERRELRLQAVDENVAA